MTDNLQSSRRNLLKLLLASPLLGLPQFASASDKLDPDLEFILSVKRMLIESPEEAINIFDLEMVARHTLPPAHYGYIATGVTDESSQIANRQGLRDRLQRVGVAAEPEDDPATRVARVRGWFAS